MRENRENESRDAYTGFAEVYDLFMDNVPYHRWGDYIEQLLRRDGIDGGLVLDLGCGTGTLTRIMAEKGYDMIGVDRSEEMLEVARGAVTDADGSDVPILYPILYLQQDMREFELYGTVRAIYSACDSINYILKEEELRTVFRLANNYLDPGGLLVFDCNTPYKYEEVLRDNIYAENRPEGSFIWENDYDAYTGINQYDLTFYIQDGEGRFRRFQETHFQKNYPLATLRRLIEEAGMELVAIYDGYTFSEPHARSERATVIARECGKSKRTNCEI